MGLDISYFGSGAYEAALPTLRSLMYWQVSEKLRLPWCPDVLRVPIMVTISQRLRSSFGAQVYQIVAEAFNATARELSIADIPYEVLIPPLAALLLSRCSKQDDVFYELFVLRDEFTDFRQRFREFEQRRRNAKNIKEWRSLQSDIRELFQSVASRYDRVDSSLIENVLGYAPDVLKPLKDPLDPSSYSGELLKKPYKWIREWWYQRPASRLFSVTKKLEQLEVYGQLIPRLFGVEMTSDDAAFIQEYYNMAHRLTERFERQPADTNTS